MRAPVEAMNTKTLYIIAGPTAVGKTALAIRLAQYFHTAVISADSRQCYKEMSIGTAKPSAEELQAVKHYFLDEFSVTQHITAADFERLSLQYLEGIFRENDIAVVCGGTGLYIKALCEGLDDMPKANSKIEEQIHKEYQEKGTPWLQEAVKNEDPRFFEEKEHQNPARLLRALVFKRSTGESILQYRSGEKKKRNFDTIKIMLEMPREQLYERIDQRVAIMMQQGLLEEVKQLYPYKHLKNLQTVGYSELFDYLDGRSSLENAVDKIKQHTRNYAKRQITWFRKERDALFLDANEETILQQIIRFRSQP
jgi:tRNA dimethylallyltransferase